MIKEIIFFAGGDSNDLTLWSNVPCLYSRTLEKKGYVVHRVNYAPPSILNRIYNHLIWRYSQLTKKNVTIPFAQTTIFRLIAQQKIRKALKQYKDGDLCIFMGNNGLVNFNDSRPSVIFCESE